MANIKYFQSEDNFFKVNYDLKRITLLKNNVVEYLDFEQKIEEISKFKKIKMNQWKNVENSFFISKEFSWEYDGKQYRTVEKPIEWLDGELHQRYALVFHNGKIWKAYYSGNYYPRVYLQRQVYAFPITREVLFEKIIKNLDYNKKEVSKWTDIKYCRSFEIIEDKEQKLQRLRNEREKDFSLKKKS